jgi:hypothetical protein
VSADRVDEPALPELAEPPEVELDADLLEVELEPQAVSATTVARQTARTTPVRARKRRWCKDMEIPFIRCR